MKYTLQVNRGTYYASCRIKDINGKIVQISKSTGLKAVEENRAAAEKKAEELLRPYDKEAVENEDIWELIQKRHSVDMEIVKFIKSRALAPEKVRKIMLQLKGFSALEDTFAEILGLDSGSCGSSSALSELADNDEHNSPLCDYIADYVERSEARVQKTTYDNYISMLNHHIYPYFKNKGLKLKQVKPKDLEKYYSCKKKDGMNPNTILKHHQLIRAALNDAVKNDLINKNPAVSAKRPETVKGENGFYTAKELKRLLKEVRGNVLETPVMLAAFLGLRRSEVIGLKWSSIDFDNHTVKICNKVTQSGKGGDYESDRLKTNSSVATMPIPDTLYTYLLELREKQRDMLRETDKYVDYLCVNETGVRLHPDFVTDKFAKFLVQNGLRRIRFHDLRHSCISMLVNSNFSMKNIQRYARHASFEQTANTYSHLYPGAESKMSECISKALALSDDDGCLT